MKRVTVALLAAGLILGICACQNKGGGYQRPKVADSSNAAPGDFLRSGFGPLEQWLNARYDITYRNMKLGGTARENIFSQEPIADIHYQFEDVGRSGSLFHLKENNISRREVLYKIARHYNLRMTVEDVNGKPAFVRVVGTSKGSRFNPGEAIPDEGAVREF